MHVSTIQLTHSPWDYFRSLLGPGRPFTLQRTKKAQRYDLHITYQISGRTGTKLRSSDFQRLFHKLENSQATLFLLPPCSMRFWHFFIMSITIGLPLWSQCYHSNTGSCYVILDWLSQPPNLSSLLPVSLHRIAFYTMHIARWIGSNTAFTLLLKTLSWFPHVYKTSWNSLVRNSRELFQSYFSFFPNINLSSSAHLISSFFLHIRLALSHLCTFIFPLPQTRMPSLSSPTVFFLLCFQSQA